MKVEIKRTKIIKDERNRVKSHLIYEPHKRQTLNNLKFDKDGIFSKEIFGNLHKCDCGNLVDEYDKICPKCGCRVIDPSNMPDFYIDLTVNVPVCLADYDALWFGKRNKDSIDPDLAKEILEYDKFIFISNEAIQKSINNGCCDDEKITVDNINDKLNKFNVEYSVENFDPENINEADYKNGIILYSVKAIKFLGAKDEWIEENTTDFIEITHPIYRPLIADNMTIPYITGINIMYSNIIKKINDVLSMKEIAKNKPFFMMIECKAIIKLYNSIINELFKELQDVKYSIVKSEVISHPISGAIRAVLINRHDIHEDVIIIGDELVETLWPFLYEKYSGDMVKINKELIDGKYLVLVNRPPTINHLSIIAMKPRIASIYPFGKTEGTNRCLDENKNYIEKEYCKKIGLLDREKMIEEGLLTEEQARNFGDLEKFGQGYIDESGVDTVGIRCVGMNPLPMDGLSADVDGDALLVIALYSNQAVYEASQNILPSNSYMNYANGNIRNKIIEDFFYAQ